VLVTEVLREMVDVKVGVGGRGGGRVRRGDLAGVCLLGGVLGVGRQGPVLRGGGVSDPEKAPRDSGGPLNADALGDVVVGQPLGRSDLALLGAVLHLAGGLVEPSAALGPLAVDLLVDGDVLGVRIALKRSVHLDGVLVHGGRDEVEGLAPDDDVRVGGALQRRGRSNRRRPLGQLHDGAIGRTDFLPDLAQVVLSLGKLALKLLLLALEVSDVVIGQAVRRAVVVVVLLEVGLQIPATPRHRVAVSRQRGHGGYPPQGVVARRHPHALRHGVQQPVAPRHHLRHHKLLGHGDVLLDGKLVTEVSPERVGRVALARMQVKSLLASEKNNQK
jgi:hypothetical protein